MAQPERMPTRLAAVLLALAGLGACSDDGDGATVNDTGVENRPTPTGN